MDLAVVVLVPEPLKARMVAARAASGEKGAGNVEPHITIVAPITVHDVDAVDVHLDEACAALAPFVVTLHGVGTFRPESRVVFVRIEAGRPELTHLEEVVQTGPLHRPHRRATHLTATAADFPFHPHATIAMRIDDAALDAAAASLADAHQSWTVTHVALLEKGTDRIWRTRRRIPLGRA